MRKGDERVMLVASQSLSFAHSVWSSSAFDGPYGHRMSSRGLDGAHVGRSALAKDIPSPRTKTKRNAHQPSEFKFTTPSLT